MRYILTYSEIVDDTSFARDKHFTASSDSEAEEQVKELLDGKETKDITLWRRGDFVILGRESV